MEHSVYHEHDREAEADVNINNFITINRNMKKLIDEMASNRNVDCSSK